jgi:CRISPR-associated protein Cas1
MATLYLDRQDMDIRHEGKHWCLYAEGQLQGTVPLNLVERVVVTGRATLSTGAVGLLAEKGIGLLLITGRQHRQSAMLLGRPHGDVARRVAQYRWHCDESQRCRASRALVLHKLRAQARFLRSALPVRPDRRAQLIEGIERLEQSARNLRADTTLVALSSLRGIEGAAAAAYFQAYCSLFAPSLEFTGRNRRPPRDPVNAVLSLGYTLLHFEAVQACHMSGLDPYLGVFHDLAYNRESLALDLIEPLRPRFDHLVWRLFAERTLRKEAFTREGEAVLLNKAGRPHFYAPYELWAQPVRRLLRRTCQRIARYLERTNP